MPNRMRVWSIVLGCALLALAGYLSLRERPSPATARAPSPAVASKASAKAPVKLSPAFDATWAAIVEADKIQDPVQRCIAYPDQPGMHWAADVVKAVCTRTGYKFPSIDDIAKASKRRSEDSDAGAGEIAILVARSTDEDCLA